MGTRTDGSALARRPPVGPVFHASELDTYKQLLQPNRHAGSSGFKGSKLKQIINAFRRVIYWPLEHISQLPGGPLRWLWIVRLVFRIDRPLRRYMLGGATNAKSSM